MQVKSCSKKKPLINGFEPTVRQLMIDRVKKRKHGDRAQILLHFICYWLVPWVLLVFRYFTIYSTNHAVWHLILL